MNIDLIRQSLADQELALNSALSEYQGYWQLYCSACLVNNGILADEYRQKAHMTLDKIYDAQAVKTMLVRQLSAFG